MGSPTAGRKLPASNCPASGGTASSKTSKKTCYDRSPRHQRVDVDVLVSRVRAVADGAKAVERWHTERRREVAIGSAAGAALFELHAELRRHTARHLEQFDHAGAPFKRRALEPARNFDPCAADTRLDGLQNPGDPLRIRSGVGAGVDDGARLVGNDVRPRAAPDDADGDRDAACRIL